MDPRGETCGNPVVSVSIFTGEEEYECSAATANCVSRPYTYAGARVVVERKDDLGRGRQLMATRSYLDLVADRQGSRVTFNLDKYCQGMVVVIDLQGGEEPVRPTGGGKAPAKTDDRWKNRNLLPQTIIDAR